MRPNTTALSREIDRKVRKGFYSPFIWAGVIVVVFLLFMSGHNALRDRAREREWGGIAHQQSEAVCVSTHEYDSRKLVGWANTFRINGEELTSIDANGCVVGKRYLLTYRIGRTGQLKVESGKLL